MIEIKTKKDWQELKDNFKPGFWLLINKCTKDMYSFEKIYMSDSGHIMSQPLFERGTWSVNGKLVLWQVFDPKVKDNEFIYYETIDELTEEHKRIVLDLMAGQ